MVERGALLVTGGAGYIGSHVVLALCGAAWPVVVLDDLSTGRRSALPPGASWWSATPRAALPRAAGRRGAAPRGLDRVAESVSRPLAYYRNHAQASLILMEACVAADIAAIVFSSSAAVYGDPAEVIAATGRIRAQPHWRPRHDDLETIVREALRFERRPLAGDSG